MELENRDSEEKSKLHNLEAEQKRLLEQVNSHGFLYSDHLFEMYIR